MIGVVTFEDTDERREVVSACRVCYGDEKPGLADVYIVSPAGVAHKSDDDDSGDTFCGKDATIGAWWWRL